MAADDWLRQMIGKAETLEVQLPQGCRPPYFITAPTITELRNTMKRSGWQRLNYTQWLAPDGNLIKQLIRREEIVGLTGGTLFVIWGSGQFMDDRARLIDDARNHGLTIMGFIT